jgi:CheY-like chemotaxis protein
MRKANCILLVDDNPTTTFLHQRLINKLDITWELLVARNGKAALELIQERTREGKAFPELILLDLNMPVMDGFEFYKSFQELEPAHQALMKVVLLTTSFASKDEIRAQQAGIRDFISKPLTKEKLMSIWPQ